jgi:serralysin
VDADRRGAHGFGRHELAWKNTTTGQFTVWDTDGSGDYVSSPTDGAESGSSMARELLKLSFD